MDYETCLKACIAAFHADGGPNAESDIAMMSRYPIPSAAEWADILENPSICADIDEPFRYMEVYEGRLSQRGFETVLDRVAKRMAKEIIAIAVRVGMPLEFVPDAVALVMAKALGSPAKH